MPALIVNKRARFEYNLLETYQAGLVLSGGLVKAIREKRVTLQSAYVASGPKGLTIIGLKLGDVDYTVPLLLKQKEVDEIRGAVIQANITCIPVSIKRVGRWFKAEIAVAKGKKEYDKRETIKQRDLERDMRRSGVM